MIYILIFGTIYVGVGTLGSQMSKVIAYPNSISTIVGNRNSADVLLRDPTLPFVDSPVCYYAFSKADVNDSSMLDVTANQYTLTNHGVTQQDIEDVNGLKLYNAGVFNGARQYLSRDTSSDTNLRAAFAGSSLTLSFWMYHGTSTSNADLVCATSSTAVPAIGTDQVFAVYFDHDTNSGNDTLVFSISKSGAAAYLVGTLSIIQSSNKWIHYVWSVGPQGNTLYIDGIGTALTYTTGSASTAYSGLNNINSLYIGGSDMFGSYWTGATKNVILTTSTWNGSQALKVYNDQLHDLSTYQPPYIGFLGENNNSGILFQNETLSLLVDGTNYIDASSVSGVQLKDATAMGMYIIGGQSDDMHFTGTSLTEPPTMNSNTVAINPNDYSDIGYVYESTASTVTSTHPPFHAFDANNSTYFQDNSTDYDGTTGLASSGVSTIVDGDTYYGSWLQIDMGKRCSFSSFTIMPASGKETTMSPNWFILCGSNGADAPWNIIYSSTRDTVTWQSATTQTFTITVPQQSYRYYRLVATVVGNSGVSSGRTNLAIGGLTFNKSGNVTIDGTLALSNTSISGSLILPNQTITSASSVSSTTSFVLFNPSADIAVTLPATPTTGQLIRFVNASAHTITLNSSPITINGGAGTSATITTLATLTLIFASNNWWSL